MSDSFYDPLSINFAKQSATVLSRLPTSRLHPAHLECLQQASENVITHPKSLLSTLSQLLAIPAFTIPVLEAFRPLLLDLCARWLDDESIDEIQRLEGLALLVEIHEELYCVLSAFLTRPSLSQGPLGFILPLNVSEMASLPVAHLHRILLIYFRLLRAEPDICKFFDWPIKPLALLLVPSHPDIGVRYLAIQCFALQVRMPDVEKEKLELEHLGPPGERDIPISYGDCVSGDDILPLTVDGWLLAILEDKRVGDYRQSLTTTPTLYDDVNNQSFRLPAEVLHPRVVNVENILLFRATNAPVPTTPLVPTPSTAHALRRIALQISRRLPTLITAPSGSGKSLLVQHLAHLIFAAGRAQDQIVTIHLSDTSLDAKSLLGSYCSSPTVPGSFEWVEGALIRAMRAGKWVVFKDVDKASGEILGMIMPLVESLRWSKGIGERACLNVPGRGQVEAAEDFMLFATRAVSPYPSGAHNVLSYPTSTFLGHQHWNEVQGCPSAAEEELILTTQFPALCGPPMKALLRTWSLVQQVLASARKSHVGGSNTRDIGLRDLEKWVKRISTLVPSLQNNQLQALVEDPSLEQVFPNPTLREEIFAETWDVFVGSLPPSATTVLSSFIGCIGPAFGFSEERARWVISGRTPQYEVENNPADGSITAVRIGHSRLLAIPRKAQPLSPPKPFALHRPSLTLLSRLFSAVLNNEPILLVGETGTGKTTSIQHIAGLLGQSLTAINLSNQTTSSDMLGGYKPVDAKVPATELQLRFVTLFTSTFSTKKNESVLEGVRADFRSSRWKRVIKVWKDACSGAISKFEQRRVKTSESTSAGVQDGEKRRKRRKVGDATNEQDVTLREQWLSFERDVSVFEAQHVLAKSKFVFTFMEGPLVKAVRNGHWVLLDEINLAPPETLEAITPLLQSSTSSITLIEEGSLTPVPRHPSFRIFASMNPATDVGKKELPPNLRHRFTELWVPPPDDDKEALLAIVSQYIGHCALGDRAAIMDVAEFYTEVRKLSDSRTIADGSNRRPHFSMRTLARALTFAADVTPSFGLRRALWEGCLMAFTMTLDAKSAEIVRPLAERYILGSVKNVSGILSAIPSLPSGISSREEVVQVGPFWLKRGPLSLQTAEEYILTPSVQAKLMDLARIILTGRFPVLIEGPTSTGKTSAVEYLARRTGHQFIRINNHEHTDIQEYLGTYVSDPDTGRLVFQDGLLVRALRFGHWIVLDELNLAPTDVVEALNRLLDDNRELVVPETQEVIRPHPNFMLFTTQNPSGLYAGRKVLSRAFRNRFLEVHFSDVPQAELEVILAERCRIPPSRAQRIVAVFQELQKRRQTGRVFETKQSFATLRDLFRWAGRDWKDKDGMGNQDLAEAGYMLLAERARRPEDKAVVKEVIENVLKVRIDEEKMYTIDQPGVDLEGKIGLSVLPTGLVWTFAFQRLFVLIRHALKSNEPVLLVGETGSGKTSVCELFARAHGQQLFALNCHQNTETADLIGGQRPVRNRAVQVGQAINHAIEALNNVGVQINPDAGCDPDSLIALLSQQLSQKNHEFAFVEKLSSAKQRLRSATALFEWHDGPLVQAMRTGDVFLLDEISLADDSVLERLNSVLEPSRSLVLAEKSGWDIDDVEVIASSSFKLVATMNPGGDYGKKELSPALRNRFTEIWVPLVELRADKMKIIDSSWTNPAWKPFGSALLDFCEWFATALGDATVVGLRDILAWINFSNNSKTESVARAVIFHHAAHMTLLDGLRSLPQTTSLSHSALADLECNAEAKLTTLVPLEPTTSIELTADDRFFSIGPFGIPIGCYSPTPIAFNMYAPTTKDNAMRILRACQLTKPILLEGSPGVGKTSLVAALASVTGHRLCRINLSDQTDLMDLYGSDLPVEGGRPGEFVWKDAAFLRAMQDGDWVLLDEMNLAPQAVLEGLNAVLDHRGTVFIPELGRSFVRHPEFRVFAAQNPLHQGGGRKGLPKSFLNRFTKVYVRELSPSDYLLVCSHLFPHYPEDELHRIVTFNMRLQEETMVKRSFGREGGPWEFNLRDILRWLHLLQAPTGLELWRHPAEHVRSVYLHRFRNVGDRQKVWDLFAEVFSPTLPRDSNPWISITPTHVQVGHTLTERTNNQTWPRVTRRLHCQSAPSETIEDALRQGTLVILTGPSRSGKTTLVHRMAELHGMKLQELAMHPAMDTSDLLGSFEQVESHAATPSSPSLESLATAYGPKIALDYSHTATFSASKIMDAPCQFEWVDGPLVTAIKEGYWLLLDNANLCSPSVLDRLNSLCETQGTLVLNERGFVNGEVQTLVPQANFRLFMTLDPRHGELSRAMRNRGVEVTLDCPQTDTDRSILSGQARSFMDDSGRCDLVVEAIRRGVATPGTPVTALVPNLPDYLSWTSGVDFSSSLEVAASVEYLIRSSSPTHLLSASRLIKVIAQSFNPAAFASALNNVPAQILGTSSLLKAEITRQRGVPSTFLSAQPIDIALNPNLVGLLDEPLLANYSIIGKAIELFLWRSGCTSLLRTGQKKDLNYVFGKSRAIKLGQHPNTEVPRGLAEVYPVIAATEETVDAILDKLDVSPIQHTLLDLDALLLVLPHTKHLLSVTMTREFDYSAIITVSRGLDEILNSRAHGLVGVAKATSELCNATEMKSGQGMLEIWTATVLQGPPHAVSELIEKLNEAVGKMNFSENTLVLRRLALDLAATATLPGSPKQTLTSDTENLIKRIDQAAMSSYEEDPMTDFMALAIENLALLANGARVPAVEVGKIMISLAVESPAYPISSLVALQHTIWAIEAATPDVELPVSLSVSWTNSTLRSFWSLEYPDAFPSQKVTGPAVLLKPGLLHRSLLDQNWTGRALLQIPGYEKQLRRLCTVSSNRCRSPAIPRSRVLLCVFIEQLQTIVTIFRLSYGSREFHDLQGLFGAWKIAVSSGLGWGAPPELATLLSSSTNQHLVSALHATVYPAIRRVSDSGSPTSICRCFITLAQAIIALYVPEEPIDPIVMQRSAVAIWAHELESLDAKKKVLVRAEQTLTGNETSPSVQMLEERRTFVTERMNRTRPVEIQRDSNIHRLRALFTELSQFLTQVVGPTHIEALVDLLETTPTEATPRVHTLQGSIAGFLQRLEAAYNDLSDITRPFIYSIELLRFGLSTLSEAAKVCKADGEEQPLRMMTSMVSFPPLVSALSMQQIDLSVVVHATMGTIKPSYWLVLSTDALGRCLKMGGDHSLCMAAIEGRFDQLLRLWMADREKEARELAESRSLYKPHKEDNMMVSDEEALEREFNQLFPKFTDDAADLEQPDEGSAHPKRNLDPDTRRHVYVIHMKLFGREDAALRNEGMEASYFLNRMISMPSVTDYLDKQSVAFRMVMLARRIKALEIGEARAFDFYRDPNVPEVRKVIPLLEDFVKKIDVILVEWPDQMVLHHLKERAETILRLSIQSPVAKVLAALERLLLQTEDWERYAHKGNSLREQQQSLTTQIVEWRRLELSCWSRLLEAQASSFAARVHIWWFQLYESAIRSTMSAVGAQLDEHIHQVSPLLDQFLLDGPVGEYVHRLALVDSFSNFATAMASAKSGPFKVSLLRIASLLRTTHSYWRQFEPKIKTQLETERAKLERSIRDFIKLASWRDTNVHALKASAEKTHRELHKCIRKFQDVLRQPVIPLIDDVPFEVSVTDSLLPVTNDHPLHISDDQTLNRLSSIVHSRLLPFVSRPLATPIDDLAVEIVTTSRELAAIVIPSGDKEAQEKAVKELSSRKRKAMTDFMKDLKDAGLPKNLKPEILSKQQSRSWLMEQEGPCIETAKELLPELQIIQKVEDYHHRVAYALPLLRQKESNHHVDISTRDLQRALALVESSFAVSLASRERTALQSYVTVHNSASKLRMLCQESQFIRYEVDIGQQVDKLHGALCCVSTALQQIETSIEEMSPMNSDLMGVIQVVREVRPKLEVALHQMSKVKEDSHLTEIRFLTSAECHVVNQAAGDLASARAFLRQRCQEVPQIYHFCNALVVWMQDLPDFKVDETGPDQNGTHAALDEETRLLNAILVITQNLLTHAETTAQQTDDDYLRQRDRTLRHTTETLAGATVHTLINDYLTSLTRGIPSTIDSVRRIASVLEEYLAVAKAHLVESFQWSKAMYKLTFVACSTLQTVVDKGFCKPPPEGDQDAPANAGNEKIEDGTGLGSGKGVENVSEEIKDESQVEGLQGEEDEPEEKDDGQEKDNDAIEMSQDFAGALEDTGDGDSDEDNSKDNDEERDDHVGDLDPLDPNAVDEKLWGDEDAKDDQNEEKAGDRPTQNEDQGPTEMGAREDNPKQLKDNDKQRPADEPVDEPDNGEEGEEEAGPDLNDAANEEGPKMDEHVQEGQTLDLPEDLDLGEEEEKDGEMDIDDELADGLDEEMETGKDPNDADIGKTEEIESVDEGEQRNAEDGMDEDSGKPDEQIDMEPVTRPDDDRQAAGDAATANAEAGQGTAPDVTAQQKAKAGADAQTQPAMDVEGKQEDAPGQEDQTQAAGDVDEQPGTEGNDGAADGKDDNSQPQAEAVPSFNPIRNLGDALKEIRRRFEEIAMPPSERRNEPNEPNAGDEDAQLEYLQHDEEEQDMQALGPAGAEEATKLRDLKLSDEEPPSTAQAFPEDVEMSEPQTTVPESDLSSTLPVPDNSETNVVPDHEQALTEGQIRGGVDIPLDEAGDVDKNPSLTEREPLADAQVEVQLREWLDAGQTSEGAEHLWRLYETLTHDLSYNLCEQLRLILEPTRATRLKGDYRTGKRLNMKKIIPYIASEFTKDKIWLRRTRPSQREYQVLIALDDSKSMAESHSIHLAYETLALVSKALSRLEVGDIGIMKFGKTVEVLHGFDGVPFSDAAGTRVIGAFKFNQTATNVLSLVETSVELLKDARDKRSTSSSSAADIWQLEIIISDGICQDHDRLKAILRRAEEERIMIVFVIIDSLRRSKPDAAGPSTAVQNSILSMNQVSYKNVGGRMELQMERYLDTFPFEYYVVLRNVEALPDVLAGTLKQFFERSSEK
ncbi:hypothetical protein FRB99_001714 [Tulasnella sp. 403]|nr:hypothetical protein FRB99_001714 [Tulasnella sp. 403]